MRASLLLASSTLFLAGLAKGKASFPRSPSGAAAPEGRDYRGDDKCLNYEQASYLANGYAQLINSTLSPTLAADILTPSYMDYSDSINFLIGAPPGAPTFSSLAAFIAGQGAQQPVPFQILSLDFTCTAITYRWLALPGASPVRGINLAYTVPRNGSVGRQIQTQYAEFNSANWVIDIHGTCIP